MNTDNKNSVKAKLRRQVPFYIFQKSIIVIGLGTILIVYGFLKFRTSAVWLFLSLVGFVLLVLGIKIAIKHWESM